MFSNDSNMNIVSTIYFTLDYYMKKMCEEDKITVNEAFLRDHLKLFNISTQHTDIEILF